MTYYLSYTIGDSDRIDLDLGFASWNDAASYAHNVLGFATSNEFVITSVPTEEE